MGCKLDYIPERLHESDNSEIIDSFCTEDILYRRINDNVKNNPFGTVSLIDLSHNIGTNKGVELSKSKDVLFSILEDDNIEIYDGFYPLKLKIISLNEFKNYNKLFICERNDTLSVRIKLQHDPVCCMFPHCVFQFFIYDKEEEIEVTFDNYKTSLGHKKYKYLRDKLRQELALMIVREVVSFDRLE